MSTRGWGGGGVERLLKTIRSGGSNMVKYPVEYGITFSISINKLRVVGEEKIEENKK